ncbi:class I SAM-dependent methyltransferase [Streptomyces sp. ME02-6978a]|uniref:class I SAM-dependent methyltransferase n=1 Tax=unclassified Streptomyces TaxID=2593676 RepID=UPI0029B3F829|nr:MULTISPECIES: class I SAM-dependent methyltransferase [unclassified Streptomyces]MDX3089819.1 class I SAM-dependent methyltransferase [Streptomyces sp. ME12-02E]MDX3333529.1 class I SAM-dependent methyltransferase [Streptomyces sp. ME02-6978a]
MPTLSPHEQPEPPRERSGPARPHGLRRTAESFGTDARRYDRARPAYPEALVGRVVEGSPGPEVLDVGCGTGIAGRQFLAAGCAVLGVEPDPRMADVARERGLRVEVATFEDWEAGGRLFDTLIAAQSWHWVDPAAGAAKAARVLRPRGRLAVFGHVLEPPAEVAEPFAAAYRRVAPDSPFGSRSARQPLATYLAGYARIAEDIRATGRFEEPERWRFDWEWSSTRERWLDLLPTTGGLTVLPPDRRQEILDAVGRAIDALGGRFTACFTTLATTAVRRGTP